MYYTIDTWYKVTDSQNDYSQLKNPNRKKKLLCVFIFKNLILENVHYPIVTESRT